MRVGSIGGRGVERRTGGERGGVKIRVIMLNQGGGKGRREKEAWR